MCQRERERERKSVMLTKVLCLIEWLIQKLCPGSPWVRHTKRVILTMKTGGGELRKNMLPCHKRAKANHFYHNNHHRQGLYNTGWALASSLTLNKLDICMLSSRREQLQSSRGSNPAEAVRIFQGEKILSTPSFGREIKHKAVCPMSHIYGM